MKMTVVVMMFLMTEIMDCDALLCTANTILAGLTNVLTVTLLHTVLRCV